MARLSVAAIEVGLNLPEVIKAMRKGKAASCCQCDDWLNARSARIFGETSSAPVGFTPPLVVAVLRRSPTCVLFRRGQELARLLLRLGVLGLNGLVPLLRQVSPAVEPRSG